MEHQLVKTKQKKAQNESNVTETAFLDAAEIIFSENGYAGASMRAIAKKANANLGTLHYYFGTKEALIKKTLERRLKPTFQICLQELEACWPESNKESPDITQVLNAYIKPIVDLSNDVNPEFDNLMLRTLNDPSDQIKNIFEPIKDEIVFLFIRLLKKCNKDLSIEEFYWRLVSVLGSTEYMFTKRSYLTRLSYGEFLPDDSDQGIEEVIYNLSIMFMAPSIRDKPNLVK